MKWRFSTRRVAQQGLSRSVLLVILGAGLAVGWLVRKSWPLIKLLFHNDHASMISITELNDMCNAQLIPKIIHQTYKTTDIPEHWKEAQESCMALHNETSGWRYMFWTDDVSLDFVTEVYPEYLETYISYDYDIQQADAIRYFVLHHYGGIYVDLDDGCNRSLEPLLAFPAWVRKTQPTGISNDMMGAIPGHAFFQNVIDSLESYNGWWISPYITIMATTGPLFLSLL